MSITGLHIRRRLRRRFVRLLDRGIALLDPSATPTPPSAGHASVDPQAPAAPAAATAGAAPTPASAVPTPPPAAAPLKPLPGLPAPEPRAARPPAEPAPPPAEAAKPTPAERQARHWERTRKGLLRFIHERGGAATLQELHEHSESTYFVAHVSFSRMMEELTGGGQLSYDHDTATATLTEAGRAEL